MLENSQIVWEAQQGSTGGSMSWAGGWEAHVCEPRDFSSYTISPDLSFPTLAVTRGDRGQGSLLWGGQKTEATRGLVVPQALWPAVERAPASPESLKPLPLLRSLT